LLFASAQLPLPSTVEDVVLIVAGLIEGIVHKDDLDYLQSCMTDTESLVVDSLGIYTNLKEGGLTGIGEAIISVGQFIVDLPPHHFKLH